MKILSRYLPLLAAFALALTPSAIRAQDVPPPPPDQAAPPDQGAPPPDQSGGQDDDQAASFQTFYDQLGDQGTWIQTDNYGYVFQPNVTDPDWAPYRSGHWVYTDVGWTWDSDEPWGWATYHYGRWANIDGTGWVWVPGYRWAPAWVSWRYGGGYCGWAPLPPETFVGAEYGGGGVSVGLGFHFGNDVDVNFNIGPGCYNFVEVGYLGDPDYRGHYLDRGRNYTVINHTTNITNINVTNNNYGAAGGAARFHGVTTGGPAINEVNAHSHRQIQTTQLTAANQPGRGALQGNSLAVYAPRVNAASLHTAKPTSVSRTLDHPKLNRGTAITQPLAVNSTLKPTAPSQEAITAAKQAQSQAPSTAKIATEKNHVKSPLTKPLTAMEPVGEAKHTTTANPAPTANTANPGQPHASATSPFTGEPQKPATTYHPQTQNPGGQTYHPQTQETPAPATHPQTQNPGGQTYHPQTQEKPAPTYHPQTQNPGGQTYHPQTQETPAPTYHPQSTPQSQPSQSYHPQAEPQHEPAPASHPQPAPASHPQPAPAPAPAAKQSPAPSGNGNKNANDKDQQPGQNH